MRKRQKQLSIIITSEIIFRSVFTYRATYYNMITRQIFHMQPIISTAISKSKNKVKIVQFQQVPSNQSGRQKATKLATCLPVRSLV